MDIAMDTRFSSRGKYIAGAYGKADSGETTSNGKKGNLVLGSGFRVAGLGSVIAVASSALLLLSGRIRILRIGACIRLIGLL